MKNIQDFQNKTVLVLGLARSGMSAAKLLKQLGAFVVVNDRTKLEENPLAQELIEQNIKVITGSHPISLFEDYNFEYVVKNPGIPYTNVMVEKAIELKIPVITEVELAWRISEAPILGITGTNGKTTTTMMLNNVLNKYQQNYSVLSGNIGYPASSVAREVTKYQILTMELSSFQLMGIEKFKPKIAMITNIYEAHLDYHKDRDEYVNAKWNIQKNMDHNDYLILNYDQDELVQKSKTTKANVKYFSTKNKVEGSYVQDNKIFYDDDYIMDVSELSLPGKHNLENALSVVVASKILNIPNEYIKQVLSEFSGVKHRMQFVNKINTVSYYNDSKATNILATQKALSGFDNSKLILIAGGLDRGVDLSDLSDDLIGLKGLITFGETKEKLYNLGKQLNIKCEKVDHITEAVQLSSSWATQDDKVLLSPANASWDQYRNFEERGDEFITAVNNLKEDLDESND